MRKKVFLDTGILRAIFIAAAHGKDWRQEFSLSSDSFRFVTSQKCVIEMYGILKTSILTSELTIYGCKYSSSKGEDSILRRILDGDEFLDIYWHRQVLEAWVTLKDQTEDEDEHTTRLCQLTQWRACYERVRSDFDNFLRIEGIRIVLYGELFAHHEWQAKLEDLAIETLVSKEDLEIVLSALFVDADIFLTKDEKLIRKSFSLPLEPNVPAFCTPENLARTLAEQEEGFKTYPDAL
jgi:hypothetical protein